MESRFLLVIVMSIWFFTHQQTLKIHYYRMVLITHCTDFLTISISTHFPRSNKMTCFLARKYKIWDIAASANQWNRFSDEACASETFNQFLFYLFFCSFSLCLFRWRSCIIQQWQRRRQQSTKTLSPRDLPLSLSLSISLLILLLSVILRVVNVDNGFSAMPQMSKYTSND